MSITTEEKTIDIMHSALPDFPIGVIGIIFDYNFGCELCNDLHKRLRQFMVNNQMDFILNHQEYNYRCIMTTAISPKGICVRYTEKSNRTKFLPNGTYESESDFNIHEFVFAVAHRVKFERFENHEFVEGNLFTHTHESEPKNTHVCKKKCWCDGGIVHSRYCGYKCLCDAETICAYKLIDMIAAKVNPN